MFSAVGISDDGAPGTPVVAVAVLDGSLVPALLTALTLNKYAVALVRPVTVAEVDAEVPSLNVDQVAPLFDEYSIT